jgi:hypothetical protein
MVTLDALWMPIVLSAVLVFVASSLVWMALPHHKSDAVGLPDEEATLAVLRKQSLKPGLYRFPWMADMEAMKSPAMQEKIRQGPVGMLTIFRGDIFNMGRSMASWFVYLLVVGALVAYVAGRTLAPGEHYLQVFRVVGTVATLTHVGGHVPGAIWWGRPWSVVFKEIADGLLYGLLTAGAFGWLWPR